MSKFDVEKFTYRGEKTREISFPLGGIGSGSIGLAGNGSFIDWEIFNRPSKGSRNGFSHIAVKAEDGGKLVDARVLNGDIAKDFVGSYAREYNHTGYGYGPAKETMAGFPHFREHEFIGTFPIAELGFGGESFPARLRLRAFNPLIPLDEDNSSIPAAFFEIEFENTSDKRLDYTAAFSVMNPFGAKGGNKAIEEGDFSAIRLYNAKESEADRDFGELVIAALTAPGEKTSAQEAWYRGGWSDSLETYWRNFTEKHELVKRSYDTEGADMATLAIHFALDAGETKKVRFILSWNVPNNYNYWNPCRDSDGKDITWKNYYAVLFHSAEESARYSLANFDKLYSETLAFRDILYSTSMPHAAVDAAASTLAVLKSPTVLRLEDGSFYGWEGTRELDGSCEGCCTHVWSYAYALTFLFPKLERSLRENDYKYNMRENGKLEFRMTLPAGREKNNFRACVDGQMGGIIKTYREWKLCGDDEWLRGIWGSVKKALEYAWDETNEDKWDEGAKGVIDGRAHHTLDMELFAPCSWLEGMYLAALEAAARMADALGDPDAEKYRSIFKRGKKWSEENLFNGEYFIQKIDVRDKKLIDRFIERDENGVDRQRIEATYWNAEAGEIKYQIGGGCEIDQLLGQWHSDIVGLGEIFDRKMVKTALRSMVKNNYKSDMRNYYNPWRLFCLNEEAGSVMCDYPEGSDKPAIPIPYCQETMHGFEYAFAGLLVAEGFVDEGERVISAVRKRYDGAKRNPWNEIECGNNYARSMSSFALLPIYSGFSCDMTKGSISFAPVISGDFNCFYSAGRAWGSYSQSENKACLTVEGGELSPKEIKTPLSGKLRISSDARTWEVCSEDGRISLGGEIIRNLAIEKIN